MVFGHLTNIISFYFKTKYKFMKITKSIGLRTASAILLAVLFTICSSETLPNQANFSGTWVINVPKSEFGDNPLYVVPKQVKIIQDKDKLAVELFVTAVSGADSTMNEKIPFDGKAFDTVTADQRTRHYTVSWAVNNQVLKLDYSSSYSGNPNKEEYHTIETWKLSEDGKELTLNKQVKVLIGYEYSVKAVYDKQ